MAVPWAQAQLRIEVVSAYNLVVDSNVESPSTYATRDPGTLKPGESEPIQTGSLP